MELAYGNQIFMPVPTNRSPVGCRPCPALFSGCAIFQSPRLGSPDRKSLGQNLLFRKSLKIPPPKKNRRPDSTYITTGNRTGKSPDVA